MVDFAGRGVALSQAGFDAAMAIMNVPAAALWSVLSVETLGAGYLMDRRPKILFERHIFHRMTNGRYDASHPDISAPTAGGYGATGANQYLRLATAIQLDQTAALQSASWGLGQIMGENFGAAGFGDVQAMVQAFVATEDNQLAGMASFIKGKGLDAALSAKDWAAFALHYNGTDYAENHYDTKLARFNAHFGSTSTPDLTVRAAQTYLYYRGFALSIDGVNGPNTIAAVEAFQQSIGVVQTGVIDETLLKQLEELT